MTDFVRRSREAAEREAASRWALIGQAIIQDMCAEVCRQTNGGHVTLWTQVIGRRQFWHASAPNKIGEDGQCDRIVQAYGESIGAALAVLLERLRA